MNVKICGIQSRQDAEIAVRAGADFLGFIFAESKRKITPEQARDIISHLDDSVKKVGVFVNESAEEITRIANFAKLDVIQLHGHETPEFAQVIPFPVIKAITISSEEDVKKIDQYDTEFVLIDLPKIGSGQKTLDWSNLQQKLPRDKPLFLAGGLTQENVQKAVQVVQPYAVDVASGVETNLKKDTEKVTAFITEAKKREGENQ
jgi:phosphoribosylanthranilate isomerase